MHHRNLSSKELFYRFKVIAVLQVVYEIRCIDRYRTLIELFFVNEVSQMLISLHEPCGDYGKVALLSRIVEADCLDVIQM